MSKAFSSIWLVLGCLLVCPATALGEEPAAKAQTTEEIIERILELRAEMEELLEALPPELREEVEQRWRKLREARAAEAARHVPRVESSGRGEVAVVPPAPAAQPAAAEYVPRVESTARAEATAALEAPGEELPAEPDSRPTCGTLVPFDSNNDGVVSGADRYWRYFRLELDGGGSSGSETSAPESLYELGIRDIEVDLRFYTTAEKETGDIHVGEAIRLELLGKGRLAGESGLLVIDADRLARGGEVELVDGSGTPLTGYQVLRAGVALETADGSLLPLLCR